MAREDQYRDRSVLIHGKFKSEKWDFRYHITPPITTAVAFRLGSAARGAQGFSQFANPDVDRGTAPPIYIYDRMDEPCSGLLEETLAFAEKGECAVCYGTGMAAISAAIGVHVKSGEHLCYHPAIYGATYSYIVKWLDRSALIFSANSATAARSISSMVGLHGVSKKSTLVSGLTASPRACISSKLTAVLLTPNRSSHFTM